MTNNPDTWIPPTKFLDPASTEWLMQPYLPLHEPLNDWSIIDSVGHALSTLDDNDREILELVFYQRKTFQEAAHECGLRAKSHAWRKARKALKNLETALRSNTELMETLNLKYGTE